MDLTEKNKESTDRHPWEIARLQIIFRLFKKYTGFKKSDEFVVLDIGCGDTYIAEAFQKKYPGCKYFAVDTAFTDDIIEEYNAEFKKKKLNISLYKNLDEIDTDDEQTDIIFLFDVLEHIENEKLFLKNLYVNSLITEKSKFLITVPAFNSLFTSHDIFLKHFRRYNRKLLIDTVKESGYSSIAQGYFFFLLLLPRFLKVIFEKFRNVHENKGIGGWKRKVLLDMLIVIFLTSEFAFMQFFRFIGIKLPGLSNYIICKKSV